jgi:hypothetical protein
MQSFPSFERNNKIAVTLSTLRERIFWLKFFQKLHRGKYTFWDSKWAFAIWFSGGICITPNVNLIANIGYGSGSTHTFLKDKLNQKAEEMSFMKHPLLIIVDTKADEATFDIYYYRSLMQKVSYKILKYIF